jgi:hypothetical protein
MEMTIAEGFSFLTAIVAVAGLAVVVASPNSQAAQMMTAGANGFVNVLKAATRQ